MPLENKWLLLVFGVLPLLGLNMRLLGCDESKTTWEYIYAFLENSIR